MTKTTSPKEYDYPERVIFVKIVNNRTGGKKAIIFGRIGEDEFSTDIDSNGMTDADIEFGLDFNVKNAVQTVAYSMHLTETQGSIGSISQLKKLVKKDILSVLDKPENHYQIKFISQQ